jgi:hypothetical protein
MSFQKVEPLMNTDVSFPLVPATHESSRETYAAVHTAAKQIVDDYMSNPDPSNAASAAMAAHWLYEHNAAHQCYWNDRFCAAVACNLPQSYQTQAAWCLVSNGLRGYFEWRTHAGYDMTSILKRLGIDVPESEGPFGDGYYSPSEDILAAIAKLFNLPTTCFGYKTKLSDEELRAKERLNSKYRAGHIL